MHVYIYDTFTGQKKYDSVLARIETRTTDLGLNGKIIRLGLMHSLFDTIDNEIKKGAKTITAVGASELLHKMVNIIALLSRDNTLVKNVPLGFIPIGRNNIADYLGISPEEAACDILSARRVEKLDLGRIGDNFFLSEATIGSDGTTIEIDNNYSIEIMGRGEIGVVNLPVNIKMPPAVKSNAQDGILELYIKSQKGKKFLSFGSGQPNPSIFSFKKLKITNHKKATVLIDNTAAIATPAEITMAKEKINMIVGKDRKF